MYRTISSTSDTIPSTPDTFRIERRLPEISIREVCAERDAPIVELETVPDGTHLLVTVDP